MKIIAKPKLYTIDHDSSSLYKLKPAKHVLISSEGLIIHLKYLDQSAG